MPRPRGKRSLTEVSESQYFRRIQHDPVGILTGDKQSAERGVTVLEPGAVMYNEASSSSIAIIEDLFDFNSNQSDHSSLHSEISPLASHSGGETGISAVSAVESNSVSVEAESECVSCLLCLCFDDCMVCKHDPNGCNHCQVCVTGDILGSDFDPESSGDEENICQDNTSQVNAVSEGSNELNNSAEVFAKLAAWSVENNITHKALRELMKLLNDCFNTHFPKDPRTLLKTPSKTLIRSCPPGLYWHAGLKNGLLALNLKDFDGVLEITFGADGIPISRSSRSSFWPILCSVATFDKIILVGAYHGNDKPLDGNDFLSEFVAELKDLCSNGLTFDGRTIIVKVICMICDAVAKSFLLCIKGHGGYFSCTKCGVEGEYVEGRVVFLGLDAPLRTDSDFRSMCQEEHHTGQTVLTEVPNFDIIEQVPLDYMHLVLLGVVRKMLNLLKSGKLGVRLQSRLINAISELLEMFKIFIPNDFGRKTRSLEYLKQFKATELRLLLFYVLPVALTVLIDDYSDRYHNFLVLHVATTIMNSEPLLEHYGTDYSQALLKAFVEGFRNIYGKEQVSHNIHNLIHLPRDVANYGVLEKFSAFRFENYLQDVKKVIRKGDKPLQQLARRCMEADAVVTPAPSCQRKESDPSVAYSGRPSSRCLLAVCGNPQYRCAKFEKFSLDASPANRYCGLTDGKIVEIHHIAFHNDLKCMVIVGRYFKVKADFYLYPLPSSHLGIYEVTALSELKCWPVTSVRMKYVRLPFKQAHVVFPILHTVPVA